ncbi:MAG: hypothetical protein OK449_06800 [Thaumarchaeota archaeon]|nr:hypothetical protein [Nitrososphaerota archaeon]
MQTRKAAPLLALVSIGLLAMFPFVAAHPIDPSLNWANVSILAGSTNTATFGVADMLPAGGPDSDCPPGATFSGTLTVTTPGGLTSTYSVSDIPCGTQNLTAVYPTAFTAGTGSPSTATAGTYAGVWAGTTSAVVGGVHPVFSVSDNFVTQALTPPPTVPQFGGPAIFVAAMGLVLVAAMKKGKVLKL